MTIQDESYGLSFILVYFITESILLLVLHVLCISVYGLFLDILMILVFEIGRTSQNSKEFF